MKKLSFLLILLASCFQSDPSLLVQTAHPKKQKQKIQNLQKKLEIAEKEQKRAEQEVDRLSAEICKAKLQLIRKQIDDFEKKEAAEDTVIALFEEEREALHKIIQEGPSPAAFEAQVELDRILRVITQLSDK